MVITADDFAPAQTGAFSLATDHRVWTFGFVSLKTVLSVKHDITVWTIKGGFDPGSKIRTCFVGSSTGIAILPFVVMVFGVLCIETSIAKRTIIRLIHKGRNTSESIKMSLMFTRPMK